MIIAYIPRPACLKYNISIRIFYWDSGLDLRGWIKSQYYTSISNPKCYLSVILLSLYRAHNISYSDNTASALYEFHIAICQFILILQPPIPHNLSCIPVLSGLFSICLPYRSWLRLKTSVTVLWNFTDGGFISMQAVAIISLIFL